MITSKIFPINAVRGVIFALVCTMWSINAEAVESVGKAQFVIGEVFAVSDGDRRQLDKSDPIFESDTIETGPKASAQLLMMDDARIAVRPNSAFIIAEYRLDGDNSASVLSVIKGGFRTLSGKIGEQAKDNYRVNTPTGTIGLRGTDHAVFYIPEGQEASYGGGKSGTYNKVYKGATFLQSEGKAIEITPDSQAGFAAQGEAPQYVADIPETTEGPVVVAPTEESESDSSESETAAAETETADSGNEESGGEEVIEISDAPAAVVADDESVNDEASPSAVVPSVEETAKEIPVAEIVETETVTDALQKEEEEVLQEAAIIEQEIVDNQPPPPPPPSDEREIVDNQPPPPPPPSDNLGDFANAGILGNLPSELTDDSILELPGDLDLPTDFGNLAADAYDNGPLGTDFLSQNVQGRYNRVIFAGSSSCEDCLQGNLFYALSVGDRTMLTQYRVRAEFLNPNTLENGGRPNEIWDFGKGDGNVPLTHRETFFPVSGFLEDHSETITSNGGLTVTENSIGFRPIGGHASFGLNRENVFSRFDVEETRPRGDEARRLIGNLEVPLANE